MFVLLKKKYLWDIIALFFFVLISVAYFIPATFDGRILYQHDASAGRGLGEEINRYREQTGETSRWTNSAFSGMPTYQIAPSYDSTNTLSGIIKAYHLWLPDYVWYLFAYLLGFYILLRAFDFRQNLAILGSIIWAFSSYFLIIIAAGHIWKVMALAYLPPLIAGIVWTYKGKYAMGLIVTALFTAFEINANHVQMTYYYLFIILFMIIAYLIEAIKKKQIRKFVNASAIVLLGTVLGVAINISNLYHTWQYGKESMRGKSELIKKDNKNQTNSGLERDYITQWSYGIGETWTLLVPNVKGGASVPLSQNRITSEKGDSQYSMIYDQVGQYWGEQPGTSGPVYVGAFVLLLFIFGLFIVKGPMKWALLFATILSVILSWGRNFMGFTDLFIDYIPMYSKFRTVASILVIAEFTIPLLAMFALKEIINNPNILKQKIKYLYVSFGLTGGIALLFAVIPTLFFSNFISSAEQQAFSSQIPQEYLSPIISNITTIRKAIFVSDAWRSFWIIVIGTVLLLAYRYDKLKSVYVIAGISILCLIDMWQVDKRYLNDEMFVDANIKEAPQEMTVTDKQILQDKSLNYRVLNFAGNTFNENETSYYHKSIGGYHAAKLRRYQELIEEYISPEMQGVMSAVSSANGDMTKINGDSIFPVINMLNTKYFIVPLQGGQRVPILNPYTFGNAWFVDKIKYVNNANEELNTLRKIDLHNIAVADIKFEKKLGKSNIQGSISKAEIVSYNPDKLIYNVESDKGGVLVFSEIYYPEWIATIDGKVAEIGRVNYVLRAIQVPSGKHKVILTFKPHSIDITETIAYISFGILIVLTVGVIVIPIYKKRKGIK